MRISKSGARAYLVALVVTGGLAVMPAPGFAATDAAPSGEVGSEATPGVPARQPAAGGYGYGGPATCGRRLRLWRETRNDGRLGWRLRTRNDGRLG